MSAENNRRGFRVLGPKDTVEMVGEATVVRHGSKPVSPAVISLRESLKRVEELHARLKKMLTELEELCR